MDQVNTQKFLAAVLRLQFDYESLILLPFLIVLQLPLMSSAVQFSVIFHYFTEATFKNIAVVDVLSHSIKIKNN
jgi:hypothetical protein